MLTNIAVMADLVIIPIISNLYRQFPGREGYVNYIISGPMLVIVLVSLAAPALFRRLGKRAVIIGGGVVFAAGALFGAARTDPLYMAMMRTLVGVGQGVVNVAAVSLIADLYDDEMVRAKITGWYNAGLSLAAILLSYFAGAIAEAGRWQDAFKCYYAAVPMVIMLILFIPGGGAAVKAPEPGPAGAGEPGSPKRKSKEPLGGRYWWMAACWLLINILFGASVLYYISPYIVQNNLGDSEFTGFATSVKSVLGFVICLGFGVVYSALKRRTNAVCLFGAAICLAVMTAWPSRFAALVLASVAGCGYKLAFSYAYAHGFSIVPAARRDDAVAVTTAVYGIGSFASTYFATFAMRALNTDRVTTMFVVPIVAIVALAVADLVVSLREGRARPAATA
jgi:MFS family permease